MKGRQQ